MVHGTWAMGNGAWASLYSDGMLREAQTIILTVYSMHEKCV